MDNQKNYRITTHHTELAMRITASSQADLFANSAFALFDVMTDLAAVEIKERIPLEIEGNDRDDLLVNWMRELLYLYQSNGYLLKEFKINQVKDTVVNAEVCGEKVDPDRHEVKQEVASVAAHKSRMEKTGNRWIARVIFEL